MFYYAISLAPMTMVTVIVKTDAFFVFVFGYFINGERIAPIELLGLMICFGTIFIISQDEQSRSDAGD